MKDAFDLIIFSRAAGCALLPADEASLCTSLRGMLFRNRVIKNVVSQVLIQFCDNLWDRTLEENNLGLIFATISICNNIAQI